MELSINTAALAAATSTVSRGVSARPTHPALGAIRLAATAGQVTLTAYDGESLFEATAPATVATIEVALAVAVVEVPPAEPPGEVPAACGGGGAADSVQSQC